MVFPDSNDEQFHKNLKEKMDSFSSKAPNELWNGIVNELNQTKEEGLNSENHLIDSKLKEAASKSKIAPHFIWYGIEQKLNLDRVWDNMQPDLDRFRRIYIFRKAVSYMSAAVILLLFIRTCAFENISHRPEFAVSDIRDNETHKKNILKKSDTNKSLESGISNNLGEITKRKNKLNEYIQYNDNQFYANFVPDSSFENGKIRMLIKDENESKNQKYNSANAIEESNNQPEFINIKKISIIPHIELNPNIKAELVNIKNKSNIEYRLGLISSVKSSIITNYDNSAKLNRLRAEDIQIMLNPSFSYGVQIMAKKNIHSFIAEFWYDYSEKQEYRYNLSGRWHSDNIEINYVRLNIMYRPSLYSYRKNTIHAVVGGYLSNLKGSSLSSTMPNRSLHQSVLNNWNIGLVLGLGQDHKLGTKFILDYGLRNEIGLSSIYNTQGDIHSKSNLMGFSAYIALAYRFQ